MSPRHADGFVEPAYDDRSIGDVLPAVAAALGVPESVLGPPPTGLTLPPAPAYVVLLVDGLGATLLRRHAELAPVLAGALDDWEVGTAGVPSTTATSLTSLSTALPPGAHGVVGYTSRIPGTDRLLNALSWDKQVDPVAWQPHPTGFGRLAAAGVDVAVVNKREFVGSGLTVAAQRGAEYVGADRVGERIAAAVCRADGDPSLTYLYEGDLDWTGHRYGVDSTAWRQQLAIIDAQVEQLRDALPDHVRLLVVADHGMVDSPPDRRVDVAEVASLREGLALLGGEARFRHLYSQAGAVADLTASWREILEDRAEVLERDEAVARGWFGDLDASVRPRIGDVVVACRSDTAVMSSAAFPYETTLIGLHGSLTPDEMLIPILVL